MKILIILLISVLTFSGCAILLIGAAGVAGVKAIQKASTSAPGLTEEERRRIECKTIKGSTEKVLLATAKVFRDRGYSIQSEDYEKQIIIAEFGEQSVLTARAYIEDSTEKAVDLRIVIEEDERIVENTRMYEQLFEDIIREITVNNN